MAVADLEKEKMDGDCTYLDSMFVFIGWSMLDFDLLLQVIHCITQLQIVSTKTRLTHTELLVWMS